MTIMPKESLNILLISY